MSCSSGSISPLSRSSSPIGDSSSTSSASSLDALHNGKIIFSAIKNIMIISEVDPNVSLGLLGRDTVHILHFDSLKSLIEYDQKLISDDSTETQRGSLNGRNVLVVKTGMKCDNLDELVQLGDFSLGEVRKFGQQILMDLSDQSKQSHVEIVKSSCLVHPKRYLKLNVEEKCDLYSFGMVLLIMLCKSSLTDDYFDNDDRLREISESHLDFSKIENDEERKHLIRGFLFLHVHQEAFGKITHETIQSIYSQSLFPSDYLDCIFKKNKKNEYELKKLKIEVSFTDWKMEVRKTIVGKVRAEEVKKLKEDVKKIIKEKVKNKTKVREILGKHTASDDFKNLLAKRIERRFSDMNKDLVNFIKIIRQLCSFNPPSIDDLLSEEFFNDAII